MLAAAATCRLKLGLWESARTDAGNDSLQEVHAYYYMKLKHPHITARDLDVDRPCMQLR